MLTRKITLDIKTLYQDRSLIEDKEYFNTTLMYKVLYHNGTPNPVQRSSENVSRFYLSTSVVLNETKLERYFYKLPWYVCPTLFLQKVLTFFIFFRFERARECKVELIYENDIHGKRVFGSKSQLMMAALSGAQIRVGFTDVLEVFDEAKNIHIHSKSNVISAELSFDLLSQWVFVIVDTNGNHLKRSKGNHLIS